MPKIIQKSLFGEEVEACVVRAGENAAAKCKKPTTYEAFTEKFKPKLTTDDCYTPPIIYDAILGWCKQRYNISDSTRIMRPFKPGGDYQSEDYSGDCIVIDNPPFSIATQIVRWYVAKGVRFFLFCPYLTSIRLAEIATFICAAADITYANGANVPTAFVTNLEPHDIAAMTCPELKAIVEAANKLNVSSKKRKIPKYSYPPHVLTAAMLGYLSNHATDYIVRRNDLGPRISALDAQRAKKKGIFGAAFLISEKAAAEKAAAEVWELSDRELEIIKELDKNK